jgi:hypothetical protein
MISLPEIGKSEKNLEETDKCILGIQKLSILKLVIKMA